MQIENKNNDFEKLTCDFTNSISDFRELVIEARRKTFWEKYSPIFIPTLISTIIGLCTFYAAFTLSEYKISVLMEERTEIRASIKTLENNMLGLNLTGNSLNIYENYINKEINSIKTSLIDLKRCVTNLEKKHELEAVILSNQISNIEKALDILVGHQHKN